MITDIYDFTMDTDGLVTVTAVVDEMVLVHHQTQLDPAEDRKSVV